MSDVGEIVPSGMIVEQDGVTEMLLISSCRVDISVGGEVEPDGAGGAPDGGVVTPEASTRRDEFSSEATVMPDDSEIIPDGVTLVPSWIGVISASRLQCRSCSSGRVSLMGPDLAVSLIWSIGSLERWSATWFSAPFLSLISTSNSCS